jgi:energy-coupling factor transporter ATP-binding protein EcfA2
MTRPEATEADLLLLREGNPPRSLPLLRYLEVPAGGWAEFLRREYLAGFIAQGGTKLKLLIGTQGSGKSHLLALAAGLAREEGFAAAGLDAFGTRLFPIDRFYGAAVRGIGLAGLIDACARRSIVDLGFEPEQLPARVPFLTSAVREGLGAEATLRRSLSERVDVLLREPTLDPTFAMGAAQAVGHRLGVFHLNPMEQDALTRWFTGEKVTLGELRTLQIYERPDRYNGRDYLRSLASLGRLAGYRGLVVCVDNMETVAHRSPGSGRQRYTRAQRDEAYETIRQLIDDVDHSASTLYLLAGRREFMEDEKAGISSYEALRLRLLQEVRSPRFNPFGDVVDLNAMRATGYLSAEAVSEWVHRLREYANGQEPAAPPAPHLSLRDLVLAVSAA